jgi:transcriptional regulator with XRE-family HTH domain
MCIRSYAYFGRVWRGRMTKEHFRSEANRKFGIFLKETRARRGSTVAEIARVVGFSEPELAQIEETAAEVPCSKLYRLIEHYGPRAVAEAQSVLLEVDVLALRFREAQPSRSVTTISYRNSRNARPRWLEIGMAVITGRLLVDLILYLFRL